MGVNLIIAVTDRDWFNALRQRRDLAEVNFWAPSAEKGFRALQPGELFLFKLHSPDNFVVGGGIFAHANKFPCSTAWKAFGEANGAHSEQEMRTLIARHRPEGRDDRVDFDIGCRILTQPFFFEERDWIPVPSSWSPNIVSFKRYNTDDPEALKLWEAAHDRLSGRVSGRNRGIPGVAEPGARFGEPHLIRPRLGQGAFRFLVMDAYGRRCAVTRERTLPALDAAHIRPYGKGGEHEVNNGLFLRKDIHSLFDSGYVTVTPENRFEVSPQIREEFENGRDYYALRGKEILLPDDKRTRPNPDFLQWHNENQFKA